MENIIYEKENDRPNDLTNDEKYYSTRIKELEDELKDLGELKYTLDQSAIVSIADCRGTIIYANDLFCEISQFDRDQLIGKNHRILNSGYHPKEYFKEMWRQIGTGHIWEGEVRNLKKDGSVYWVQATIVPFMDEKGKPYKYISIRKEITKQKQLEEEIIKSNEKYRLIAENSADLVSLLEIDGVIQYVSPSFETLLEYSLSSLDKKNLFTMIHPDDLNLVKKEISTYCKRKKEPLQIEFRIRHTNGDFIDVEANISMINNHTYSNNDLLLVVMRDIRVRKEIEKTIYHLAYHDPLTNLPNRRMFMNQLRSEIIERNNSKIKISILFIDLDNFKLINDKWGHDAGDLAIKEAAYKIKEAIRPTDMVARLGGDEFIVMLKDIQDEKDLKKYVKQILANFQTPISTSSQEYTLTCSIGIATYPENGDSAEQLITNADNALYHVKGRGKNDFSFFNNNMKNQSLESSLLENALRSGIKNEQFYLEYQPKQNIATKELFGMEALVRWNHPELGIIPPGKFIPLAEETGLIVPMGEWILRESCRQTKLWQKQGFPNLIISVNVSVRQLEDSNFIDSVIEILNETQLDPRCLELEVTESIFADVKNAASILQELRSMGIKISVDDFGTGYSSLSYIKHLPIDILKVDGSFIRDIHSNDESKAIVNAIITLAKAIGLNVIAEGIELEEHIEELKTGGCLLGQGFYFSKPMTSEAFENYLKTNLA